MNINIKHKPQSDRIRINSQGTIILLTNDLKRGIILKSSEIHYTEGDKIFCCDIHNFAPFFGLIELSN